MSGGGLKALKTDDPERVGPTLHEAVEEMPNAVSCGRGDAYVKVTGVRTSSTSCNSEPLDGESWWRSPVHDGDRIRLCVRRQFREGECFLGERGSEKGGSALRPGRLIGPGSARSGRAGRPGVAREAVRPGLPLHRAWG